MFQVINDGQRIVETNYFDSPHAKAGYCFLTWNAGAARLLLPDSMAASIKDMQGAMYVVVSRGPWLAQGKRDALELLFEDSSDNPYCIHLVTEQTDRMLPEDNQGGGFVVTVWTRQGVQLQLPGKYRTVAAIPCLDPWVLQ